MHWFTALLIAGYIGICEGRAPNAWQACESRWNWALGVLVPSPLPALGQYLATRQQRSRRRFRPDEPGPEPNDGGRSGGDLPPSA